VRHQSHKPVAPVCFAIFAAEAIQGLQSRLDFLSFGSRDTRVSASATELAAVAHFDVDRHLIHRRLRTLTS